MEGGSGDKRARSKGARGHHIRNAGPYPAALAHLDPAGLTGHLVHLPPSLNEPLSPRAPHVGASRSHVAPPPP